jgi:hypothetical protein
MGRHSPSGAGNSPQISKLRGSETMRASILFALLLVGCGSSTKPAPTTA